MKIRFISMGMFSKYLCDKYGDNRFFVLRKSIFGNKVAYF